MIEIMIVVGVLGIILAISLPAVYEQRKRAPMRETISSLKKVCGHARAQAIWHNQKTTVTFRPGDRTFKFSGGGGKKMPSGFADTATDGRFHEDVIIDGLEINLQSALDFESTQMHFYPNGTCDELFVVLEVPGEGEKVLEWESTTGFPRLLSDDEVQTLYQRLRR